MDRYINGVGYFYFFAVTDSREIRFLSVSDFIWTLVRGVPHTQKSINCKGKRNTQVGSDFMLLKVWQDHMNKVKEQATRKTLQPTRLIPKLYKVTVISLSSFMCYVIKSQVLTINKTSPYLLSDISIYET